MVKLGQTVEIRNGVTLGRYLVKKLWLGKDTAGNYIVRGACYINDKCYGWAEVWGTPSLKRARKYIAEMV